MESKTKPNIQSDFNIRASREHTCPPRVSGDRQKSVNEIRNNSKNDLSRTSSKSEIYLAEPDSPNKASRTSFITETRTPAISRAASLGIGRKTTLTSRPRSVKVQRPLENGHTKFSCACPACHI